MILYALLLVVNLNGEPQADISILDYNLTAEDCFKQEQITFADEDNTRFVALTCKPMGEIAAPLPSPSGSRTQSPS